MKAHRSLTALATLMLLTACAGPTPVAQQEPFIKKDISVTTSEDRITLDFAPRQTTLDSGQQDYIRRLVNYYRNAEGTVYLISFLKAPEDEDPKRVIDFRPWDNDLKNNIESFITDLGVEPRQIQEVDIRQDPDLLEARAWKAILDSSPHEGSDHADALAKARTLDPKDLEPRRKVAIIVRTYDVKAANCALPGAYSLNEATPAGTGLLLGCANTHNIISQVKDKTVFVHPRKLDPEYNSAGAVTSLRAIVENAGAGAVAAAGAEDSTSTEAGN